MIRFALGILLVVCLSEAQDDRQRVQAAISVERAGKVGEAVRLLRGILNDSPSNDVAGQARLELVRLASRRGDWWEAAEQLEALRRLAPNDPEYAYQLGMAYQNLSKAAFFHMQAIDPASARVQQMMGEQYSTTGDTARAADAFRKAIAADPKLPGSHLALAVIQVRLQHRQEAIAEINKELEVSPESALAKEVRAAILRGQP